MMIQDIDGIPPSPSPCCCHCEPSLLQLIQAVTCPCLIHPLPLLVGCHLSVCCQQAEKRSSCVLSSYVAACHAPHHHSLCHCNMCRLTVWCLPCCCRCSMPSTGRRIPRRCRCSAPSTARRLPQHGLCLCSVRPLTAQCPHRHCLCNCSVCPLTVWHLPCCCRRSAPSTGGRLPCHRSGLAVDTIKNEGQVMGDEGGRVSSIKSYNIRTYSWQTMSLPTDQKTTNTWSVDSMIVKRAVVRGCPNQALISSPPM
jgi:hypothetical protein